jgi:hypothetical protein
LTYNMTLEATSSQALPFTGLQFVFEDIRQDSCDGGSARCMPSTETGQHRGEKMQVYLKDTSGIRIRDAVTHAIDSAAAVVAIKCSS